ncbi:binding-protein-dependent transport systems inner membrane component [Syntrophobotulus glycolicus DSM 8271]|uniref:Binding-protein-dependent transport systems inner membrane component n=1 Tax=Syntrophobotulus glycolicus (strain DSM 8271 / FlGlyR) TaxID=645991 RepID=F0SYG6_SYNGF|nr:methionine ABC transporter permease [Syntrophobotulus glycolicus]ADY57078.1 binding-protein-dependent transport systems inner membrane component [Syntrophobotulus glycolicus DSM 8271]
MSEDLPGLLFTGFGETIYMVALSTFFALLLGLPFGIILVTTDKHHISEAPRINKIFGTVINIVRSFPFIILIVVLLPLSRFIVGTTLGSTAAIVPLSIGASPFVARIIENSLKEVGKGKIEAALAVGANPVAIIARVLIPEALPSLIRGITLAVITITGFTAVAGAIGAGGLGSLAIRYGYMRFRDDVMVATVLILVFFVQAVQWGGDSVAKYIEKRRTKIGAD